MIHQSISRRSFHPPVSPLSISPFGHRLSVVRTHRNKNDNAFVRCYSEKQTGNNDHIRISTLNEDWRFDSSSTSGNNQHRHAFSTQSNAEPTSARRRTQDVFKSIRCSNRRLLAIQGSHRNSRGVFGERRPRRSSISGSDGASRSGSHKSRTIERAYIFQSVSDCNINQNRLSDSLFRRRHGRYL